MLAASLTSIFSPQSELRPSRASGSSAEDGCRRMITTIGLDADDTLWESEVHFVDVEDRFREMIARYDPSDDIQEHLLAVERHNLSHFGYGVKSFTLSMIETAIQLTDGAVNADDIHRIVMWGKDMMGHPVELLPGVREAVTELAGRYELVIFTKGDLFHQEAKVAQSGLAELVQGVEVMTEKDVPTYDRIFQRREIDPGTFLMVGNSVRSDVLPIVELGGHAAHIPHNETWAHELDDSATPERNGYHLLSHLGEVADLALRLGS